MRVLADTIHYPQITVRLIPGPCFALGSKELPSCRRNTHFLDSLSNTLDIQSNIQIYINMNGHHKRNERTLDA